MIRKFIITENNDAVPGNFFLNRSHRINEEVTHVQYKMVQIPPNVQVAAKSAKGNEAATYLETLANEYAAQGWEFQRVDEVGVVTNPGCLASIFGARQSVTLYYVVTFRKSK